MHPSKKIFIPSLLIAAILGGVFMGWFSDRVGNIWHLWLIPFFPIVLGITLLVLEKNILGIYACLLLLAIVPPAPKSIGLVEIIYITLFIVTVLGWVFRGGLCRSIRSHSKYPIIGILFMVVSSIVVGFVNGVSFGEWFRGIVPFGGLLLFFVSADIIKSQNARQTLVNVFYIASLGLIILSFGGGISTLGEAFTKGNFWVFRENLGFGAYQPLVTGIPLFAYGQIIVSKDRSKSWKHYSMLVIGLTASLSTLLRSNILVTGLCFLLSLLIMARVESVRNTLLLIVKIISVAVFSVGLLLALPTRSILLLYTTGVQNRLGELIEQDIDANVRILEAKEVLSHFLESPLFGKGIGFQYEFIRGHLGFWQGGYTHNIVTYFLLTMGAIGLLILAWWFISIYRDLLLAFRRWPLLCNSDQAFLMGAILYIASILIYVQFQSVFRHISFFSTLSIMLGAVNSLRSKGNESVTLEHRS